jgi:hypothetical protein
MAECTTQRRHRQREGEKQEQQPVENTCHEKRVALMPLNNQAGAAIDDCYPTAGCAWSR